MFTKIAINYLMNRAKKIDDSDKRRRSIAFLKLIRNFILEDEELKELHVTNANGNVIVR